MDLKIARHQAHDYTVQTAIYAGPLDLLLHLIERAELDITALSLAQVTDQYLGHIQSLQEKVSAEEISAFLVIAAKLLQIKSEALLPRPPQRENGEDAPGEELARQLRLYKRFKAVAELLKARQEAGLRAYLRLTPPPKSTNRLDLDAITLDDIVQAAQEAFNQSQQKQALGTVIAVPKITIREKIQTIRQKLAQNRRASFRDLLSGQPSRLEIVVTFLAMLELIKRYRLVARQEGLFHEIIVERSGDWSSDEDFELEFE